MPFMHGTTFEITEFDMRRDHAYFEVDDLLALAIQILNRKGYYTYVCCEGHPFDTERYLDIAFHDSVDLPYLPDGFNFEHCRLQYYYKSNDRVFEFEREKVDICEALTAWADGLPENPLRPITTV
jgi:hypothetical protein